MNHPLDGARLKIVRAHQHLDSLKAEIGMYMSEDPYTVSVNKEREGFTIAPVVRIDPPVRLSTIVGDCITNARAALDYVVWELAVRYFVPAFDRRDRNDRRITSFPLYVDPIEPGYIDRLDRLAKRQIPAGAIDCIKSTQPYNRGYESLWWLHELVNTDKHQTPLLAIGVASYMHSVSGVGTEGTWIKAVGATKTWTRSHSPEEEMQVDGEATGFVAFQDVTMPREPVDRTLEQIIETVANVIPRFDSFF